MTHIVEARRNVPDLTRSIKHGFGYDFLRIFDWMLRSRARLDILMVAAHSEFLAGPGFEGGSVVVKGKAESTDCEPSDLKCSQLSVRNRHLGCYREAGRRVPKKMH